MSTPLKSQGESKVAVAWVKFAHTEDLWPGISLDEVEVGKSYERYVGMSREPQKIEFAWLVKEPVPAVALAYGTKVEYVPLTAVRRFRLA